MRDNALETSRTPYSPLDRAAGTSTALYSPLDRAVGISRTLYLPLDRAVETSGRLDVKKTNRMHSSRLLRGDFLVDLFSRFIILLFLYY